MFKMKFEAKTYKRVGSMIGGIIGIFAMIIAVCIGRNLVGAGLLILFVCIGVILGSVAEKKYENK